MDLPLLSAGDYYISQSTGSDANPGTIGAPWRTLAKVNGLSLQPSTRILLKSGDTWTGETLTPSGNGVYDSAIYASTFSSTLSANTATYQGGAVFSAYHTQLLSDGVSEPAATDTANSYCIMRARADAIQAAHAAADASGGTSWITVASYGAGARPKIAPGGAIKFGIKFATHSAFTGGYKIKGVDIDSCKVSAIDAEVVGVNPHLRKASGLWIEDCKLTNITGMAVGVSFPGSEPGYIPLCSSGVSTTLVDQLVLKNVEATTVDAPTSIFGGDGLWVTGCNFHDSNVMQTSWGGILTAPGIITGSTYVTPISNFLFEDSVISNMGATVGYAKGVAGVAMSNTRDFIIRNTEITLTKANQADGIAIDFEGNIAPDINGNTIPWIGLVENCNIHNNAGGAMLHNQNTGQGSNPLSLLIIHDNLFTTNGSSGLPAIIGQRTGLANNNIVCTSNDMTRGVTQQKLFGGDATHVYSPLTNTPPAGYVYGASNTDHFP